ncbi:MAG: hypothetical protein Q4A47_05740 [Erysipelotrichaceae bacterium]|nr:hypothetical protein [Erysipelotrichaceae bacterium]
MSILWTYFPKNREIPNNLNNMIEIFCENISRIDSNNNTLSSDEVLGVIAGALERKGYKVEKSKKREDKIRVPALYGECGKIELAFEVDAYHQNEKIVLEVEAGRAVTNYQFLKDLFEACMMQNVEYLCIAVRIIYGRNKDYSKVCDFMNTMFLSNRFNIPLKGILIIGY